jgi:hypothetical protein
MIALDEEQAMQARDLASGAAPVSAASIPAGMPAHRRFAVPLMRRWTSSSLEEKSR